MELWSILVLALLKEGINCDFDRLAELANKHLDVRRMLGLSDTFCDWHFSYRTLVRNVSLLTPDLLAAVNRLVVEAGLRLVGHAAEELGVPVSVVECEQQFVLHWQVMWEGEDVDVACPLVAEAQELYPCLAACSFDKGFHSPANRERLDAVLELNALPRKGRLSKADREREGAPAFRAARRAHAAVESAINNLEQRGLGRVRAPMAFV